MKAPRMLVLASAVLALLAAQSAAAFVTDSGFQVAKAPTLFANMKNYTLIGPSDMTVFTYVPGPRHVLVGGTGYFALVDVGVPEPRVVWAWSLIGRAERLAYDDSWSPSWYAAASQAGEIMVVDAKNPDFRKTYFTASRVPVADLDLGSSGGETRLAVVDSEGYLYIYRVPGESWLEIGPEPRDGPVGKLPNYTVLASSFLETLDGRGNRTMDAQRLAVLLGGAPTSSVVAYVYYLNETTGEARPAIAYSTVINVTENQSIVRVANLSYGFVLADYGILLGLGEANVTVNETGLPATKLRLLAVYSIADYDPVTDELIGYKCYAALTGFFEPEPGGTYILGRVVLEKVDAASFRDCIDRLGVERNPEGPYQLAFHPVMALNTVNLPRASLRVNIGGDAWIIYYPYPARLQPLSSASIWEAYRFQAKPEGWPVGAESVVLASVGRYLYIYVVDYNLVPVRIGSDSGYVEVVDVGSDITTIDVSWDGSSIYVGTSSGKLFWLRWDPGQRKYVAVQAMQIDEGPVTSIAYLEGDYVLVASSSGRLQLVRASGSEWYPVWRGPYGYDGVETKVNWIRAEAVSPDLIVAGPATQSNVPSIFVLRIGNVDIVRATVHVVVKKVTLEGGVQAEIPAEGVMEVYDSAGDLVAVSPLEGGTFTVYLESGSYTFALRVPGLGLVETTATVSFPEYRGVIEASYREVMVTAVVPAPGEGERYPEGIAPGPLPGAIVIARPVAVDPNLGYNVTAKEVYAVTGDDGVAVLTLWEGVVYEIIVSKEGFENFTTQTPAYGAVKIRAQLKPVIVQQEQQEQLIRYYDVRINVLDDRGMPVKLARVEVYYAANDTLVASTFTDQQGQVVVRLQEGSYLVKASAEGYLPKQIVVSVPETTEVTISLDPTTATKIKRLTPYIVMIAGVLVLVGVLYALRERIARRLVEEGEYF